MNQWSLIILLCICLASASAAGAGSVKVELEPRNPLIATGGSLLLNCTLSHSEKGLSARELFFRVSNSLLNASLVAEVLTTRTMALKVTNVQRNMSGVVECHHQSKDVTPDATRVLVADKPKKPLIRDCKVYNWENMSCFWDGQENGIQTNISVCYSLDPVFVPSSVCYSCPNRDYAGEHSCSWWKYDDYDRFVNKTYWLFIIAKSKLGYDYDVRKVDPNEHVQPGSVLNLTCSANDSRSFWVNWSSPAPGKNLNYRIKFKSHWDNEELIVNTNKTSVELTGLIPATDYQLTVDCIPLVHGNQTGFWSSPEFGDCRTQTDVPAMNPPVTSGGYRVLRADGSYDRSRNRRIQLFWQPIPRRSANGKITEVCLRIKKLSDFLSGDPNVTSSRAANNVKASWKPELPEKAVASTSRVSMFSGSVTNATVDLDVESKYILTVEARTSAGFNESLVPASVVIPKENEAPPFPEKFVVTTDFADRYYTYINVSSTFLKACGYTIYWCTTAGNRPDICSSPYEWTRVSSLEKEHELYLPDHPCSSVRFHVSVESVLPSGETVSSGMQAVDSIYSRYGGVAMPENLRSSKSSNQPDSLTVRWNVDKSLCKRSAYISRYVIRYCSSTCQEKTVEGSTDVAILSGLVPETVYRIQMKSSSFNHESNFTEAIVFTTPSVQGSQRYSIVIVISVAVTGMVLVFVLLLCCTLKHRTKRDILIVPPKKCSLPVVEIQNDGYRPQVVPNSEEEDPYLLSYNRSLSVESSRQIHVICSPVMTPEPSDQSSHVFIPHVSSPDTSSSSSLDYSSVHDNSSAYLRILPDVYSSGNLQLPDYNAVAWEVR